MIQRLLLVLGVSLALVACGGSTPSTPNPLVSPTPTTQSSFSLPSFGSDATAAPAGTPTEIPTDTPEPTPTQGPIFNSYVIRSGDTLGAISNKFNMTLDDLMRLNGLTDANSLQIGQVLKIPTTVTNIAPGDKILPDSEVVFGPAYKDFDIKAVADKYGGYFDTYTQYVDGKNLTGPEVIELVAERFSVGPRVLLALMEYQGNWLTSNSLTGTQEQYPMGFSDGVHTNLFLQAEWAANQLNAGYYGKLSGKLGVLDFTDHQRARLAGGVNPGTAAIQNVLSKTAGWDDWQTQVAPSGFLATYIKLFGDPQQYEVKPLIPKDLQQPVLRLPMQDGKLWYFTGGPHAGWVDGSPWAAVDFAPADQAGSCWPSQDWTVAAAPGVVTASEMGRVVEDLDGDGFQGTGWALLYMHQGDDDRATVGTKLETGDHIGHPSCVGGEAETSHTHFARLYNGQWIPAGESTLPMVLSGWTFHALSQEYDGTMTRGSDTRTAENQRIDSENGLTPNGDN